MASSDLPKVLVVDDEEAILETMTFTFMDIYEVHTSVDARRALEILDEEAPVAVVITDQRMPNMTGVEFLAEVFERHPQTVRIMLTGFADTDATIEAINSGHVYAYINKPWEQDQLKQLVKGAVELHNLSLENTRLVEGLRQANFFLGAVMDRLETGALAVDAEGLVRASNRPAREYLGLAEDPQGRPVSEILAQQGVEGLEATVDRLAEQPTGAYEDLEFSSASAGSAYRLRVSVQTIGDEREAGIGRVIMIREISHEPLRRRFEEVVGDVSHGDGELRARLERALADVGDLATDVQSSGITSASMAELSERASRTQTAMQNWLDVDDVMAREEFPDAQILLDRMRIATQRWPHKDQLPERVVELARQVEAYYESGEKSKQRVL